MPHGRNLGEGVGRAGIAEPGIRYAVGLGPFQARDGVCDIGACRERDGDTLLQRHNVLREVDTRFPSLLYLGSE